MSSAAARVASQAARTASKSESGFLNRGAKRDPELYILLAVTCGATGLAGYFLGKNPTTATSESKVRVASGSLPWQGESDASREPYKYQYHPGADPKNAPKDAPSALNTVIVPNVNLPSELHEKYNKWGKDRF